MSLGDTDRLDGLIQALTTDWKEDGLVSDVLVYNADGWTPLHRVSLRHAMRMLFRQVAEVHEAIPDRLIGMFPLPVSVRLVRYIPTRWRHSRGPAWSRAGVFARDGHRCAYCGRPAAGKRPLTIDHVTPRAHGGANTWANTVTACDGCNQRKRDRTLADSGMVLRFQPYAPTWEQLAEAVVR